MLILPQTRFDVSYSRPFPQNPLTSNITESGLALVYDYTSNPANTLVKASTGASGEVFAGFAITDQGLPTKISGVQVIAGTGAAVTNIINLGNYGGAFVSGSCIIVDQNNVNVLTLGTPKATVDTYGNVSLTAANLVTDTYTCIYSYTPTVAVLTRLYGEFPVLGAISVGANVGLAKSGTFTVTNFDTSANWVLGSQPKLAAGGFLSLSGSGTTLTNYAVSVLPSQTVPYITFDKI